MPDDVGGRPFSDGGDPDDSVDRGGADEEFATVVFDEDFVRAAAFHEPTAIERLLAAAQARAEAESEAARARARAGPDDPYEDGYDPRLRPGHDPDTAAEGPDPYGPDGGALRPYRGSARWHRPVAWVLALVMGVGMVALAFSAVYRGASQNRQDRIRPPATTGVDKPRVVPTMGTAPAAPPAPAQVPAASVTP
ncbi:SCO2584 family spore wall biosynthesis protein [Streptomyces laurentii]|uniref:SCO2584 family spore wall biosynthesis protein n=1 Tax=Streptomyces laurentii TaxID=39478 RepID=UPI0036A8E604